MQHYSGYTEEELSPIFSTMIDYLRRPVEHEAFYRKYAHKKFMKGEFFTFCRCCKRLGHCILMNQKHLITAVTGRRSIAAMLQREGAVLETEMDMKCSSALLRLSFGVEGVARSAVGVSLVRKGAVSAFHDSHGYRRFGNVKASEGIPTAIPLWQASQTERDVGVGWLSCRIALSVAKMSAAKRTLRNTSSQHNGRT